MQINIQYEGEQELNRALKIYAKSWRNLREPMALMGNHMLKSIHRNFRNQGIQELGIIWPSLSDFTLRKRKKSRKKGGSKSPKFGNKMLMVTGKLFNSIKIIIRKSGLLIVSMVGYGQIHQFGATIPEHEETVRVPASRRRKKNGKYSRVRAHTKTVTVPTTDIPARPFVAVKPSDFVTLVRILNKWANKMARRAGWR